MLCTSSWNQKAPTVPRPPHPPVGPTSAGGALGTLQGGGVTGACFPRFQNPDKRVPYSGLLSGTDKGSMGFRVWESIL